MTKVQFSKNKNLRNEENLGRCGIDKEKAGRETKVNLKNISQMVMK